MSSDSFQNIILYKGAQLYNRYKQVSVPMDTTSLASTRKIDMLFLFILLKSREQKSGNIQFQILFIFGIAFW